MLSEPILQIEAEDVAVLSPCAQTLVDAATPYVNQLVPVTGPATRNTVKCRFRLMYLVEALASPMCYFSAKWGFSIIANIIELIFVLFSALVQWATVETIATRSTLFPQQCEAFYFRRKDVAEQLPDKCYHIARLSMAYFSKDMSDAAWHVDMFADFLKVEAMDEGAEEDRDWIKVGVSGLQAPPRMNWTRRHERKVAVMGIPLPFAIRTCTWDIATMAPNFITALQAAALAGQHQSHWSSSLAKEQFTANWSGAGSSIAWLGMPSVLFWLVVGTLLLHGFMGCDDRKCANVAESLNLHYLGKSLSFKPYITGNRRALICLLKPLKLWAKVSLVCVTWEEASTRAKWQGVFAIILGFYAFVPLLEASLFPENYTGKILMCCIVPFLVVMALHLLGIVVCASHDLSVTGLLLHGEACTPPVWRVANATA